jgi:phage tail-like protein
MVGMRALDADQTGSGALYALDPDGRIFTYDPTTERIERPLDGVADGTTLRGTGIAVSRTDLFVINTANNRLHALSRETLRNRWTASVPGPVAVVADGRRAVVLARGTVPTDAEEAPDESSFESKSTPAEGFIGTVNVDQTAAVIVSGLSDPVDLTISNGILSVLNRVDAGTVLRRFELDGTEVGEAVLLEELPITVETHGNMDSSSPPSIVEPTCIEAVGGHVLIGSRGVNGETSLFQYRSAELDQQGGPSLEAIHGFNQPCQTLLCAGTELNRAAERRAQDSAGNIFDGCYVIDEDTVMHALETRWQVDKNARSGLYDGEVVARFDAGDPGMQWHRVTAALAGLGAGTEVSLTYFATDTPTDDLESLSLSSTVLSALTEADISDLWDLIEQQPEVVVEAVEGVTVAEVSTWQDAALDELSETWTQLGTDVPQSNPRDALLTDANGRYLHVRLTLVGTETASPTVSSFSAYCPRQSYLRYLPELYREDEESAAFLERFLALFESVFLDVEESFDAITSRFDPYGAPSDTLDWLGQWLAVEAGADWPESTQRELIAHAPALYRRRGTRAGLLDLLELVLGDISQPATNWNRARSREREYLESLDTTAVRTAEHVATELERYATLPDAYGTDTPALLIEYSEIESIDDAAAREPYERLVGGPHAAHVLLAPFVDDKHRRMVAQIVASETPAHASVRTEQLHARFILGNHTYLGINSMLPGHRFELDRSALGVDTELYNRETTNQEIDAAATYKEPYYDGGKEA